MVASGGGHLDVTRWSQGSVGYTYKDLAEGTSSADWSARMKEGAAAEHRKHNWEVNHISIGKSGEEAVVVSQMSWQNADLDAGVINAPTLRYGWHESSTEPGNFTQHLVQSLVTMTRFRSLKRNNSRHPSWCSPTARRSSDCGVLSDHHFHAQTLQFHVSDENVMLA